MRLVECSIEEGHSLSTGAGFIGAEGGFAGAVGDTLFHCPQNCGVVIRVGLDVREAMVCVGGLRFALCPPQESDDFSSGAILLRAEGCGRGAVGDAVFHRPQNCLVEIIRIFDISEGTGRCLRRGLTSCSP